MENIKISEYGTDKLYNEVNNLFLSETSDHIWKLEQLAATVAIMESVTRECDSYSDEMAADTLALIRDDLEREMEDLNADMAKLRDIFGGQHNRLKIDIYEMLCGLSDTDLRIIAQFIRGLKGAPNKTVNRAAVNNLHP